MLVYKYGLYNPIQNGEMVNMQLRAANAYWNKLVELEISRRDLIRAAISRKYEIVSAESEAVRSAKEELDRAEKSLKDQRARTRSRSETKEQRDRVKACRVALSSAKKVEQEAKKKAKGDAVYNEMMNRAYSEFNAGQRAARGQAECSWGTYLCIEDAMDKSSDERSLYEWDKDEKKFVPRNPRFRRVMPYGTVAVQVQKSRAVNTKDIVEGDGNWLQLKLEPDLGGDVSNRRRKRRRGVFRMRIGSDGPGNRIPIWAEWPIIYHRPLPESANIKWAKVIKRRVADRDKWELHLTLDVHSERRFGNKNRAERRGHGAVFFNYGWRQKEDGRRVAYWRDDYGREDEVLMESRVISGLRKVSDLESIRQKIFNEMKESFRQWRHGQDSFPDWFSEHAKTVPYWKSVGKFVSLLRRWESNRWDGDSVGFDILNDWFRGPYVDDLGRRDGGDRHLWQWQEHQRRKSINRRNDHYRRIAAEFARRYEVLVIEDWDMSQTKRKKKTEDQPDIDAASKARQETSAGILRDYMVQAFMARGGSVYKIDSKLNTQRCNLCGCEVRWDASPKIEHTCPDCQKTWDQDANNVLNTEVKYKNRERSSDGQVDDKKSLPKWAKRGRHNGTARKETDKVAE